MEAGSIQHRNIENPEIQSSNIYTVLALKCLKVLAFGFAFQNHMYFFIVFIDLNWYILKIIRVCFQLKFKRSSLQNTARFLCQSVNILVYVVKRETLQLFYYIIHFSRFCILQNIYIQYLVSNILLLVSSIQYPVSCILVSCILYISVQYPVISIHYPVSCILESSIQYPISCYQYPVYPVYQYPVYSIQYPVYQYPVYPVYQYRVYSILYPVSCILVSIIQYPVYQYPISSILYISIQYPVSCILESIIQYPISCYQYPVSSIQYPVYQYPVSSILYISIQYPVSCILVSSIQYPVYQYPGSSIKYSVSCILVSSIQYPCTCKT